MPNRFCAICGNNINENAPHFGMCLNCYLKEHPLFELPEKFTFNICLDCGNYSIREEWNKPEENEFSVIINEVIFKFLLKPYLKKETIDFNLLIDENSYEYTSKDLLQSFNVIITGILNVDENIKHQQTIKVNLNQELCKNCSNIKSGTYYLSIIQLRVKNEKQFDFLKGVIENINDLVERLFQKDNRQYISKMDDQKYGVDLYLSTNELMNHILSYLRGIYHFKLMRSKKLVGRDTQKGKNLYRLKSLIRFLHFKKNDDLIIDNCIYKVESITKNRIILRAKNGAKLIKDYSFFFKENISIKDK